MAPRDPIASSSHISSHGHQWHPLFRCDFEGGCHFSGVRAASETEGSALTLSLPASPVSRWSGGVVGASSGSRGSCLLTRKVIMQIDKRHACCLRSGMFEREIGTSWHWDTSGSFTCLLTCISVAQHQLAFRIGVDYVGGGTCDSISGQGGPCPVAERIRRRHAGCSMGVGGRLPHEHSP